MNTIDDWQDPRLDPYRNLRDPALRERDGRFVAEGTETLRMLLRSPVAIESVILKPSLRDSLAADLALRPGLPVYSVPRALLGEVVGYEVHRGALACGFRPPPLGRDWLLQRVARPGPCRLLLLDAVHDAWNVGGILRSARGLGLDAVVLGAGSADPWYRRSIRVSMGHVFHIPIIEEPELPGLVPLLVEQGLACYAGQLGAASQPLSAQRPGARWAVVVGNEDRAVSPAVAAACRPIHIPMAPGVDSLNAGVSAALLAHGLLLLEERA